ncbi:MAG: CsbD family protein [Alphaproteobacteria bacterium]|nr:CsbD family protein [Alphaproteobacteria bacterium]
MNWEQAEGKWDQLKGQARQQWGKLTDDDLAQARGRREELAGRIKERYGVAKEEAERQVDDWMSKVRH